MTGNPDAPTNNKAFVPLGKLAPSLGCLLYVIIYRGDGEKVILNID